LHQIAHVGVSQSRGLKLFGREVILEEFQPMSSRYLIVTDGQTADRRTDRRTKAISIPRYALVHRAVKTKKPRLVSVSSQNINPEWRWAVFWSLFLNVELAQNTARNSNSLHEASVQQAGECRWIARILRRTTACMLLRVSVPQCTASQTDRQTTL